jgi:hypothetical protein
MMQGNDANVDQLQLTSRISAATECSEMLEVNPEWDCGPCRLRMPMLKTDDISSSVDHINLASWSGDVSVANMVLQTCWNQGRQLAESELTLCSISPVFALMEKETGYDLLCLLGKNKIIAVNGSIHKDEVEEEVENDDVGLELNSKSQISSTGTDLGSDRFHNDNDNDNDDDDDLQPDIEDLAADLAQDHIPAASKMSNAWVNIETDLTKPKCMRHKATVCRFFSNLERASTDRLRRVRGISRYNEELKPSVPATNSNGRRDILILNDPAATLFRTADYVYLGIIQISTIKVGSSAIKEISMDRIRDPNMRIGVQLMQLILTKPTEANGNTDWEWTRKFEVFAGEGGAMREVPGHLVEAVDPVCDDPCATTSRTSSTWHFRSSELEQVAMALWENVRSEMFSQIPAAPQSGTFPYRKSDSTSIPFIRCVIHRLLLLTVDLSKLYFLCEDDMIQCKSTWDSSHPCARCPDFFMASLVAPKLIQHMRVPHFKRPRSSSGPCCLRFLPICGSS